MKKISMVLLAVLLIASLFISCDNNNKALENELVEVRIGTEVGSRGLVATVDLNDQNLTWYYSAKKVTETSFKFGETNGAEVPQNNIVTFSQGKWDFGLWALNSEGKKVYSGTVSGVLIIKNSNNTPTSVIVPVSPYTGENGYIVLDNVKISAKTDGETPVQVSPNYASIDDVEIVGFSGSMTSREYATGSHEINVAYKGTDGITYASETIYVTVYSGRTTTVTGFVDEETGSAEFGYESTVAIVGIDGGVKYDTESTVKVGITPSMEQGTESDPIQTTVTFPTGSFSNTEVADAALTVNVKPIDSNFSVGAAGTSTPVAGIDITLLVNNQPVTQFGKDVIVETFIAKELSGVKVYYDGAEIPGSTYDPSTGRLTFKTNHFSEFYAGADVQAKIGDVEYCLLKTAFDEAQVGDAIKLAADVVVDSQIVIRGKSLTLDLNGKAIKVGNSVNLSSGIICIVNDGYLTIEDTSAEKTGKIDVSTDRKWYNKNNQETDYPAVWADIAVYPDNGKKAGLTVNGGTYIAPFYTISGNGSNTEKDSTTIVVNDGTFTTTQGLCIYHPQNGTLTVNGGTFTGQETAIEIRSGNLYINGGEFTATDTPSGSQPNGSGTTSKGAAIAVAQHTTKLPINVVISDGTFKGYSALYESNPQNNGDEDISKVKLEVLGGNFNTINDGSVAVYSEDCYGFIKGGTFSSDPSDYAEYAALVTENEGSYTVSSLTVDSDGNYLVSTANELVLFEKIVNEQGRTFSGKTVKLSADIDLNNITWTPVGSNGSVASYPNKAFAGTFDGNGHTISNLKVSVTGVWAAAGLFGTAYGATIKNVAIDNASIKSTHYAGGILGYQGSNNNTVISECVVKKSTITSEAEDSTGSWDNGDKVGGIVGYIATGKVEKCSVSNTTITGYRDLGGIVGYAGNATVQNNTVDAITITVDNSHNYKNYTSAVAHDAKAIVGEGTCDDTNTAISVTINAPEY